MKKKNIGSTLDSWLRAEGLLEKVDASALRLKVEREDLERINAAIDELGPEAEDVLRYQSLDDSAGIE